MGSMTRSMRRRADRERRKPAGFEIYVYSAGCTWHGPFIEAARTEPMNGHRLPCCPHCGSPLYQYDDRAVWEASIEKFIRAQADGFDADLYRRWMQWLHDRGTCERLKDWDWRKSMTDYALAQGERLRDAEGKS